MTPGEGSTDLDALFLTPSSVSADAYSHAIRAALEAVLSHYASLPACYSGKAPRDIADGMQSVEVCPEEGRPLPEVLAWVGHEVLRHSIVVSHPDVMAHLHCPPLMPALAAEVMISAMNQSMDSWDQAPSATFVEERVVNWLATQAGLGPLADGVFTSGGTQSNFMALMLARDAYAARSGWRVQTQGLPPEASRYRILCSEVAHFSVQQAAAVLGLGHQAVVRVATDSAFRMNVEALERQIDTLRSEGAIPIAVVATAGTTDFGSIDPLSRIADTAAREGLWMHVDAAYAGGLLLSARYRDRLCGIERADSVTVDFHKMFWMPISGSALLLRDRDQWDHVKLHAAYLNPEEPEIDGEVNLVTKSLQTTRRFDGLKVLVSLQNIGRRRFAEMMDRTLDLAREVADCITREQGFVLAAEPQLSSVVFRFQPEGVDPAVADEANIRAREQLWREGRAIVGRTRIGDRIFLKFTLLNPRTTLAGVRDVLRELRTRIEAT